MGRDIRSKYHQGTLRSKHKIMQCQGEKDYFKITDKDCYSCKGRSYCYANRFRPFNIKVESRVVVFADTFENAKECASKGYGWLMQRAGVDGLPMKVVVDGDVVSFRVDLQTDY